MAKRRMRSRSRMIGARIRIRWTSSRRGMMRNIMRRNRMCRSRSNRRWRGKGRRKTKRRTRNDLHRQSRQDTENDDGQNDDETKPKGTGHKHEEMRSGKRAGRRSNSSRW